MGIFSQLRADWKRHKASASILSMPALANYRFGRWLNGKPWAVRWVGGKFYMAGLLVAESVSGIFLDRHTEVGEELHFVHAGGINIHPMAKIGNRVGIMHGVTIGVGPDGGVPTIGDDVFIGANASVCGNITVGDKARVAANSLVLANVPPGALAIGVPAKMLPQLNSQMGKFKKKPKKAVAKDKAPASDAKTEPARDPSEAKPDAPKPDQAPV